MRKNVTGQRGTGSATTDMTKIAFLHSQQSSFVYFIFFCVRLLYTNLNKNRVEVMFFCLFDLCAHFGD